MRLSKLPRSIDNKIRDLARDDQFQKIWGEDKVLNELVDQVQIARAAYKETWDKLEQRKCQLVIDYLIDTKKVESVLFFSSKLKKIIRDILIRSMKDDDGETLTCEDYEE